MCLMTHMYMYTYILKETYICDKRDLFGSTGKACWVDMRFSAIHCNVAVCCSVFHCVAVCCSVLQCVAVCCKDQSC